MPDETSMSPPTASSPRRPPATGRAASRTALVGRIGRSLATAWSPHHVGPRWAPWLWTTLFSLAIGAAIVVAGGGSANDAFVTSVLIGLSIHAIFASVGYALRWDMFEVSLPLRLVYGIAVSLAGSAFGFALSRLLLTGDWLLARDALAAASPMLIAIAAFCAAAACILLAAIARLRRIRAERIARQLAASEARREAALARLQLLNAQVEPHFLYNSLAHVDALIASRPDAARALVAALVDYLRLAARNLARPTVPLADELASVRGYLDVMRHRMGTRLVVVESIDPATGPVELPPASVQTLVENAIKHGLEPAAGGGRLEIAASRETDGGFRLDVRDSGVGLAAAPTAPTPAPPTGAGSGGGIGLDNLRERLRLCFGDRARLTLESPAGGGACATIRIAPEATR